MLSRLSLRLLLGSNCGQHSRNHLRPPCVLYKVARMDPLTFVLRCFGLRRSVARLRPYLLRDEHVARTSSSAQEAANPTVNLIGARPDERRQRAEDEGEEVITTVVSTQLHQLRRPTPNTALTIPLPDTSHQGTHITTQAHSQAAKRTPACSRIRHERCQTEEQRPTSRPNV